MAFATEESQLPERDRAERWEAKYHRSQRQSLELASALLAMVVSEVDYVTINKLGNPFELHNVKLALSALSKMGDA